MDHLTLATIVLVVLVLVLLLAGRVPPGGQPRALAIDPVGVLVAVIVVLVIVWLVRIL